MIMDAQAQNSPILYACIEFMTIDGQQVCKTWQELPDQPVSPSITKEQANDITLAVLSVIILAFGWFIVIRFLRKFP